MNTHMTKILAAVLLGGTSLTSGAFAQDASAEGDAVKAVYERNRPDYDAPGIRTGSFLFYPSVEGVGAYNSNIYAQESNVTHDFIAKVKPSFSLMSDWNQNFLSLSAKADIGRYFDHSSEDYEDYGFDMNGRRDISHGVDIHGGFSFDRKHEDRGSPDANGLAISPTKYSVLTASAGFKRDVSILSLGVDGEFTRNNYDNALKLGGGYINNDARDRDRYKGTVRFGYELSDGYEAFVRVIGDRVKYDNSKAAGGPQRNSNGYQAEAGASFDLTGKAKGEFYAGYMKRKFDSETMGSIDGIDFGASLLWNVTGLTSVRGTVKRDINETTVGGLDANGVPTYASGIKSTLVSLRIEHELQRNLLLSAEGSYTRQDFARTVRSDDLFNAKFGLRYLVNRNLRINAGYNYDYRNTTTKNQDYQRHSIMVGITGQW
ncbi:outer membrane beta-barrel protein [Kordiimonas marina]|uniref:outer membrane beta-barrel protein n=1 Tax=Kordiimonas marina TaxID=2872312 RepID=UPI001FF2AB03|nr:outer membrane beta-barrel protein [Kordiimonas marina]MCJ9429953.1 outer membrane beta-barrel protein [Kordiimonas marina]